VEVVIPALFNAFGQLMSRQLHSLGLRQVPTWDCFDPGVNDGTKVVNTGPHTVLLEFGMVRNNRRSTLNSADEGQLKDGHFNSRFWTNQIQHYGGNTPHAYLVTSCRMPQFLVHPSHLASHEASLERLIQSGSTVDPGGMARVRNKFLCLYMSFKDTATHLCF
jgi:hypothetical protein